MNPIFIGGTGRSGTTILKKVLTCHSRVTFYKIELRMIVDPDGVLDLIAALSDSWSPYNADIAIHRFRQLALACASTSYPARRTAKTIIQMGGSPWRYYQIGIGNVIGQKYYRSLLDSLINSICHHTTRGSWAGSLPLQRKSVIYEAGPFERAEIARLLADFINNIYCAIPNKPGSTHWVEDTPYNLLSADLLCEVFPEMHLIHIYRDPRDVLASYRTKHWGGKDVVSIARRLAGIYQQWSVVRERLMPEQFTEISLEQLAENPRHHLAMICERTGLEYESSLESIALDKVHAGRWRKELTDEQAQSVSQILGPFIEQYGYL